MYGSKKASVLNQGVSLYMCSKVLIVQFSNVVFRRNVGAGVQLTDYLTSLEIVIF